MLYAYDSNNNMVQVVSANGVSSGPNVGCATDLRGAVDMRYATNLAYDGATDERSWGVGERLIFTICEGATTIQIWEDSCKRGSPRPSQIRRPHSIAMSTPRTIPQDSEIRVLWTNGISRGSALIGISPWLALDPIQGCVNCLDRRYGRTVRTGFE